MVQWIGLRYTQKNGVTFNQIKANQGPDSKLVDEVNIKALISRLNSSKVLKLMDQSYSTPRQISRQNQPFFEY